MKYSTEEIARSLRLCVNAQCDKCIVYNSDPSRCTDKLRNLAADRLEELMLKKALCRHRKTKKERESLV